MLASSLRVSTVTNHTRSRSYLDCTGSKAMGKFKSPQLVANWGLSSPAPSHAPPPPPVHKACRERTSVVDRPPTHTAPSSRSDQQQAPLEASGRVKCRTSLVLFTRLGPPEEFSGGCTPVYTCKLPGNSQHILDGPWRPAVTLQGARFGMCSKNLMEAFSKYVHEAVEAGPPPASPPHGCFLGGSRGRLDFLGLLAGVVPLCPGWL